MLLLRAAAAALLSVALVGASAVGADAEDGGGVCTVTIQLPATAESGRPFTMQVREDSGCTGASGLQPFTVGNHLEDGVLRWGYDGIGFSHAPGTGDADFVGTAPNPGTWRPRIGDLGAGYRVVLTTMVTTPQVTPTPTSPSAKAVWVDDTLRIAYPWAVTFGGGVDEYWTTYVDGKRVSTQESPRPGAYGTVEVARKASAGPARVEIVGTGVADIEDVSADTDTLTYSATISRRVVGAKPGQASADTLLRTLKVRKETRSVSDAASRFGTWVDADHDGRSTRTEVLKAESLRRAVVTHGRVTAGKWLSRYDATTVTDPKQLVVDHLVPLQEAWTSGAASWSAERRAAFANDVGYGPSLIAVSRSASRARGGREITASLPPNASFRCAYARSWIAVKSRWGLTIDPAEKSALSTDLTLYCLNPYVTKPTRPDVSALVGRR